MANNTSGNNFPKKDGTEVEIVVFPESETTTHCSHSNPDCRLQFIKNKLDEKNRILGKIYNCSVHEKTSFFMSDTRTTYKE